MAQQDIVGGLFGITPEGYQQQQDMAQQAQALRFAQLAPAEQTQYSLFRGGQQLGSGLTGLMGVEDPQMRLISQTNQLVQQIGIDTPEKLKTLAGELQKLPGGAPLAAQAVQQANKMLESAATVKQKTSEQVKQVGLTTDGRQVYQSGANQFILTEQGPQPYYGALESKQSKTSINVNTAGETEVAKVIGKGIGESQLKTAEAGEAAAENLLKINETLNELKTNQAFTGSFADLQTNIAKAQAKFADDKKAGKRVTDTEYLDALLGSDVFPMISSLGIGARGLDTPAEREFLRKVMTGTVSLERDTLIKLTETRKNIAERAVKKYNAKVESGELNKYFQLKGVAPQKIELPKAPPAASVTPGSPPPGVDAKIWNVMTPQEKALWQR